MALQTNEVLAVQFENIPQELKDINCWVLWKVEKTTTGFKKVPIQLNGKYGSSTNSDTWTTFSQVQEAHEQGMGDGIGIVLNSENDLYVLDIDNTQEHDYYEEFKHATYCEYSPSGNGIHIYMLGNKPKRHKNESTDTALEFFSDKRFMTVTGHQCSEIDYVAELDTHIDKLIEKEFTPGADDITVDLAEPLEIDTPQHDLTQEEVMQAMAKSEHSEEISMLMQGDISNYDNDHSRADWALISHLAYWTARNEEMMFKIFAESGLYNVDRGKRRTPAQYDLYVKETIRKAVIKKKVVYEPQGAKYDLSNLNDEGKLLYGKELKQELKRRRNIELDKLIQRWEANEKKGTKPKLLSPLHCAIVLAEYVPFIYFNNEENTKIAMYLADEGIYTQNRNIMYRIISWIEPTYNKNKSDDVLFHIGNRTEVKDFTVSRSLIPVNNGVFNLDKKRLEPFTPEYVFTTKINTDYKTNPKLPIIEGWDVEEWIREIACFDDEIVRLLWQVVNDSLNANYTRRKAIFLVGSGNNGKSTFTKLLTHLIGFENVATLTVNEFEERFKLSMLEGKTVVLGDDVPPNVYVDDSSAFKKVTTGDTVTVEQKNMPVYSRVFRCTVIQSTNELPRFRDKSGGITRRFLIVPFKADFEVQKENFAIKDDYVTRQEVLEYVLHKAINLDFEEFDTPKISTLALDEFKQDNDPIYEFKNAVFDEWTITEIPKELVYSFYKLFCEENGYRAISKRKFISEFQKYLGKEWDIDKMARFDEIDLERHISLNELKEKRIISWNYPDPKKPYRTFRREV